MNRVAKRQFLNAALATAIDVYRQKERKRSLSFRAIMLKSWEDMAEERGLPERYYTPARRTEQP